MLPLLHWCWDLARYLLRPEDGTETERDGPAGTLAGAGKALFWAAAALLAGLCLARLN